MRWAIRSTPWPPMFTFDDHTVQVMGEQLLVTEAERHNFVIVGPVAVKILTDKLTDDHTLHAEADVITRRMPPQGRK